MRSNRSRHSDQAARQGQGDAEFARFAVGSARGNPQEFSDEETEKALQGQQTGKEALDNGARRGDRVLREFQKSVGG